MNITVEKNTTYRGRQRRVTGYTARIAGVYADGDTPQAAKDALGVLVERACTYARPYVVAIRGYVAFVSVDRGVWSYTSPHNYSGDLSPHIEPAADCGNYETRDAAVAAATTVIAQIVWDGTTEDTESLASLLPEREAAQFREWVTFQTRYQQAHAAGLSDAESHAYAGNALWARSLPVSV